MPYYHFLSIAGRGILVSDNHLESNRLHEIHISDENAKLAMQICDKRYLFQFVLYLTFQKINGWNISRLTLC